jgi:hypothetical protein
LPEISYGCKTWSLTLKIKYKLRTSENKMLREIFGPNRDERIEGCRILHNQVLHNWYPSPNIIRMIKLNKDEMGGNVARMGNKRKSYRFLVGKANGKIPLGRARI